MLFVDDISFPNGWAPHLYQEDVHPEANHVHRRWSNPPAAGIVSQNIWRSYTTADAQESYTERRRALFQARVDTEEIVMPLKPPEEIEFQSTVADEYYLACTWERWAYCSYLARYRNYVTYLRLDREAELGTLNSKGLTYAEIETVLTAVDAKFATYLEQFPEQ